MQVQSHIFIFKENLIKFIINDNYYHCKIQKYENPFKKENFEQLLNLCMEKKNDNNQMYYYELLNGFNVIEFRMILAKNSYNGIDKWFLTNVLEQVDYKTFYIHYLTQCVPATKLFDQLQYLHLEKELCSITDRFKLQNSSYFRWSGNDQKNYEQLISDLQSKFKQDEKKIIDFPLIITNVCEMNNIKSTYDINIILTNYCKCWIYKKTTKENNLSHKTVSTEWHVDDLNFQLSKHNQDILQQLIINNETFKSNGAKYEIRACNSFIPFFQCMLLDMRDIYEKINNIYNIQKSKTVCEITEILDKYGLKYIKKEKIQNKDELFKCPICFNKLDNPTVINCGHTFCKNCISDIDTCTMCNQQITSKAQNFIISNLLQ